MERPSWARSLPLFTLQGACCDGDGELIRHEYMPLRESFAKGPGLETLRSRLATLPGSFKGRYLRSWSDKRGKGWIASWHGKERWFSLKTWKGMEFAQCLAKLQLALWQCREISTEGQKKNTQAVKRQRRLTIVMKEASIFSPACEAVFGHFNPLFAAWLGEQPRSCTPGLNESPFDIYAMLCASRLFSHLHPLPQRCRLRGKRRITIPLTPLAWAARSLISRQHPLLGLAQAVESGDLDAVRYRLLMLNKEGAGTTASGWEGEVGGAGVANAVQALLVAVRFSKGTLVNFLVKAAWECCSQRDRTALFHEALAACWRCSGGEPLQVLETLLAAGGVDLEKAIWPELPKLGLRPEAKNSCDHPEESREDCLPSGPDAMTRRGLTRICAEQLQLPFLRRGDGPLAWAVTAHTSAASSTKGWGHLLCILAKALVKHGADQSRLSRRQRLSLVEILGSSES
mmetsp:Transcript_46249/g.83313  ORF Transcript_46249/g.83313 Transcript_46249/m.83313 type:complete len:458 (-) Transcript_46249:173-1546(-)